tara:strand:- start:238 stop:618 length:381 start_codon:yes stop_codon:yes gene_type:complete
MSVVKANKIVHNSGSETTEIDIPSLDQRMAKVLLNYNGSAGSIRHSYNISSVVDNGTGDYTVNFASALADTNYVLVNGWEASPNNSTRSNHTFDSYSYTTTSVRILGSGASNVAQNFAYLWLAIFR